MRSRVGAFAKFLFLDLIGSVVHFPIWWYSTGFKTLVLRVRRYLTYRLRSYAFGIWMKNFFVPIYNIQDWTGRLISIVMRFAILIGRGISFGIECALSALLLACWIVAPPAFLVLFLMNIGANVFQFFL